MSRMWCINQGDSGRFSVEREHDGEHEGKEDHSGRRGAMRHQRAEEGAHARAHYDKKKVVKKNRAVRVG